MWLKLKLRKANHRTVYCWQAVSLCKYWRRNPNFGELPLSSACDFIMGFGKPQLRGKFEAASPSRCRNIIGKPKILGSSPSQRPFILFLLGAILWIALANSSCVPNLKSLASAVEEILMGKRQISESSPSPGPHPLFFQWDLMMGLDKPQLHAKFEVDGFIYYGNIREFVFKRQIRFSRHPFGEIDVTYGLHL